MPGYARRSADPVGCHSTLWARQKRRMSGRFTLLLVVSVHLACSGGITRDQAARLIAANDSFTTVAHFAILTDAPLVSICTCQKQADLE